MFGFIIIFLIVALKFYKLAERLVQAIERLSPMEEEREQMSPGKALQKALESLEGNKLDKEFLGEAIHIFLSNCNPAMDRKSLERSLSAWLYQRYEQEAKRDNANG